MFDIPFSGVGQGRRYCTQKRKGELGLDTTVHTHILWVFCFFSWESRREREKHSGKLEDAEGQNTYTQRERDTHNQK